MQRDAEHFQTKLSKIDGFGDLGQRLLELVQGKSTSSPDEKPAPSTESPKESPRETSEESSRSSS
jgi:vacuolar protein sorting-associated protein 54